MGHYCFAGEVVLLPPSGGRPLSFGSKNDGLLGPLLIFHELQQSDAAPLLPNIDIVRISSHHQHTRQDSILQTSPNDECPGLFRG